MRFRPLPMSRLLIRFIRQCVSSGVVTAKFILRGYAPTGGLVRMPFAAMHPTGAAVLGALVTLTPGSSTIDIDLERREILLHVLDLALTEENIAAIRRDFEADLCLLFPAERP